MGVPVVTPPLPLRTERLVLRTVLPSDRAAIGAYCADPEVTRYLPFPVLDEKGLDGRMERMLGGTRPSEVGEPALAGGRARGSARRRPHAPLHRCPRAGPAAVDR
ncbi:GNAT family N-acetyltransferase [Nocardioides sp. W3-2-3]|uniref:GNAT family N-acetyltransferase n=1 Tax=Nocardioides convexus TaxID=2712224 RepID=UPI0024189818|nr:GNAT family N-acetyltransferase [Nocardioides convexus]NHA01606.1 GNAT family N-acetyltransferase [Nocardioides convexus]